MRTAASVKEGSKQILAAESAKVRYARLRRLPLKRAAPGTFSNIAPTSSRIRWTPFPPPGSIRFTSKVSDAFVTAPLPYEHIEHQQMQSVRFGWNAPGYLRPAGASVFPDTSASIGQTCRPWGHHLGKSYHAAQLRAQPQSRAAMLFIWVSTGMGECQLGVGHQPVARDLTPNNCLV